MILRCFFFLCFIVSSNFLYAQKNYNVVLILSDDQRYNTIHALGNNEIITPSLDRLVKMGTAFTRAHTMGARQGALCMPSRVMLLAGRYANHLKQDGAIIATATPTFAEALRAKGYTTFQSGKWHSDKASYNRSFSDGDNIFFGGMNFPDYGGQEQPRLFHYDSSGVYPYSANWQGDHFSSDYYTEAAIRFINRQKNNKQPFFCYLSFTSPHDPRTPPEKFRKLYDVNKISLPPSFMPQHPFDNGELNVRDELLLPKPLNKDSVKAELAAYYAMITEMDNNVGKLLDTLEANGQLDNTLIIFAGDNGLALGNHGLLGKQNLYDHSIRVPLIIAGPGLPKNQVSDELVYLSDISPTVYDFKGLAIPASVESKSLLPVIKHSAHIRDHIYFLFRSLQRGIRTNDNWKLILYNVNGVITRQLFNLNEDPAELTNLAADKKYAPQLKRLTWLLKKDMIIFDDDLDISRAGWKKITSTQKRR